MDKPRKIVYLLEHWILADQRVALAGVWWYDPQAGWDFWYKPQYDKAVKHYQERGKLSDQWASYFAANSRIAALEPLQVLEYYSEQGGYKYDRPGPFEIEVEGEVDPQALIEATETGAAKRVRAA